MAIDDVVVFDLSEDGDLAVEQSTGYLALDVTYSYFFDCYLGVGLEVGASIDSAEGTFSYFLFEVEEVLVYLFEEMEVFLGLLFHEVADRLMFINNGI